MYKLNLLMKKQLKEKKKEEEFKVLLQNKWLVIFKSQEHKGHRHTEELFQAEENERDH